MLHDPSELGADVGLEHGCGDLGMIRGRERVADIVEQCADDIVFIPPGIECEGRGLQTMCKPVNGEAAVISVEEPKMGEGAIGHSSTQRTVMLGDDVPVFLGAVLHLVERSLIGVGLRGFRGFRGFRGMAGVGAHRRSPSQIGFCRTYRMPQSLLWTGVQRAISRPGSCLPRIGLLSACNPVCNRHRSGKSDRFREVEACGVSRERMPVKIDDLPTPALLIDGPRLEANLASMA